MSGRHGLFSQPLCRRLGLPELAGKVLADAQIFINAHEQIGYRHRLEKQIAEAATVAEVEAVVWCG